MKKEYKDKYKRKLTRDEETLQFAIKAVSTAALFFVVAIGMDVFHLFH